MAKSSAEKGVLFLSISKIYFLIAGYILIFSLTRILGPEGYGIYSPVNSLLIIINSVLLIGTIQSVSKFVSEDESQAEAVKQTALKLQIAIAGSISLIYYLLAPFIADLLNDPSLVPYLRMSIIIMICYSFYGIYLGYVNGRKFFVKQAFIDMTFSTIKVGFMVGLAYYAMTYTGDIVGKLNKSVDLSVYGTFGGFALAAVLIVIICMIVVKTSNETAEKFPIKKLLAFQGSIIVYTLILNMLLQADSLIVKALTDNVTTGIYAASLQLSRIPYQVITAVTFVVFPLISEVTFKKDLDKAKVYIHNTLRFCLIILTIIVVLFATTAKGSMLFIYKPEFESGASVLAIYIFGVLFFALFFIMATVISGYGKPNTSCVAALITLIITSVSNYIIIPVYGVIGAACATTISMFIGMMITSFIVYNKFKGLIHPINVIRILVAGLIIYIMSMFFPVEGHIPVVIKFVIFWNIYFVVLFLIKELTMDDIMLFKKLLPVSKKK